MNNFDDWSQIISKYLKSESDPLGSLAKYELEDDAARAAFIRAVLERFLPEIYGIGSGQIMDASGKMSGKLDIIIYRKDFPRLDLPGSRDIYLFESVIATIEVTAKLVKKSFFEALDQCASLADLNPQIDPKVMAALAARNQLSLNGNKQYVHPDPMRTARFHLIGRPLSFIYAFSGYKTSTTMMVDTINAWIQDRRDDNRSVDMKSLPAVIATQGCFAWRNSAPFSMKGNALMGVGFDAAPVRLIVLQLLHALSRKLRVTTDAYGLKPTLDGYLTRMPPPVIDIHVGKALNPQVKGASRMEQTAKLAYKRIETPVEKTEMKAVKGAIKPAAAEPVIETRPDPVKTLLEPAPKVEEKAVTAAKPTVASLKTLSSLNEKPVAVDAPFPVPNAELIPDLDSNPPEDEAEEAMSSLPSFSVSQSNSVQKPKSTVDFELEAPVQRKSGPVAAVDSAIPASPASAFIETVKMNMANPKKEIEKEERQNTSASDDFVETVKLNLALKEPFPELQPRSEPEPEPFTSTIPQ
ncbi:MAG: hypothetical protein OEY09_06850 [Gammaproteobacteria bacterium]|nr:hypothetical protein [Gammaproteobacteria bacterium]